MAKNPLEKYFDVLERGDGVYIKHNPDKPVVSLDELEYALSKELIINCDWDLFTEALNKRLDEFFRIGPIFEYYQTNIEQFIDITINPLEAALKIDSQCSLEFILTENQLRNFLSLKGVRFGIDDGVLKKIVDEALFDEKVVVARGKPPVKGNDALINIVVDLKPVLKPEIKPDGSVDYRNVKAFTPVASGQLLASKTLPTAGVDGVSVKGETIKAEPGVDRHLPKGRNTTISDDGIELISLKNGVVCEENGLVCVKEILAIHGNVDFSVGNIKHSGDVLINGNVLAGFSVEANGNVIVKGEVESARIISREGFIVIEKGVIGRGDTFISAKAGISVAFAQETKLKTDSSLSVSKFIIHCECLCQSFEGPQCNIIGGTVKAEKSITAKQVGSEKEVKSLLVLYDKIKEGSIEKLKEITELQTKLEKEFSIIERQLKSKAAIVKQSGKNVTNYQREEVKKWIQTYNQMKMKVKYVEDKIDEIKRSIQERGDHQGHIYVSGQIFEGTQFDLFGASLPQKLPMTNKNIRVEAGVTKIEG